MSMRFIYGRAGTGKSEFCLKEIKEYLNSNNLDNKVYLIVPEQFSYSTEKKLLEIVGTNSVVNAEVISFNRIAHRVFTEVGGISTVNLSKSGKAMLIYNILENNKKDLEFLGKSNENIELILKTITELKKHNINTDNLKEQIEKTNDKYLKIKLQEINNIYEKYENIILNNFIDEDDILTLLGKKINKSKMFKDAYVYIDEFSGFTNQEYIIISEILNKAKQVNISICADNLEKFSNPNIDIFYSNKQVIQKLIKNCQNQNIKIDNSIQLTNDYRFKNKELKFLEQNIYNIKYGIYENELQNIHLKLCNNPYTEIKNVANTIIKLVRDNGYRFRDIAIITKDIESYSSIIKVMFNQYNIPVFIDERSDLSQNILVKYILAILDIYAKNWSSDSVYTYLKTGFSDIEKEELYKLENYCNKWGIKGNKWFKDNWNYDYENEDIEELNNMRKNIVEPLLDLKNKVDKQKTVYEITKELYNFLERQSIKEKLKKKIKNLENINEKEIAKQYISSWDLLISIFDEVTNIFKDQTITFEKYRNILKAGLDFSFLGKIPQGIDEVIVGDVERSRNNKVKNLFILGLNDGNFPSVNRDEGFLNDKDRDLLKANGMELAKGTIENLYEDQFNIYKAFSTAEENLYLSYISSDKEGKTKRPSILISKIRKIFIKLKEESSIINNDINISTDKATFGELLLNIRNLKNGEDINTLWIDVYKWYLNNEKWNEKLKKSMRGFEYRNDAEKIKQENIKRLYGEKLKVSISRLEQYKRCPFSFHLKYGLKLKEKEEFNIKPIDTGSFMHEVIEKFFEEIENIKKLNNEDIKKITNEIIQKKLNLNKNYIFLSSPKFISLTNRLKKVIIQSIQYIVEQIKNSDFNIEGTEVEFSKNIDNIQIIGKIDRIDTLETEQGKFIRIIDYKSSQKDIDLNEMISGTQIQLITYIDSMSEKTNAIPAGMLYFNLINPIIKGNRNLSDEEIEKEIRKKFKMNGIILADINVIKLMDKKLNTGFSEDIPVYIDKDGEISKSRSNVITKEQFTNLQKVCKKIIKQISQEILNGSIDIKPIYNKKTKVDSCKYCEYKSICRFNSKTNNYSYIGNKTKEEILNMIKGE